MVSAEYCCLFGNVEFRLIYDRLALRSMGDHRPFYTLALPKCCKFLIRKSHGSIVYRLEFGLITVECHCSYKHLVNSFMFVPHLISNALQTPHHFSVSLLCMCLKRLAVLKRIPDRAFLRRKVFVQWCRTLWNRLLLYLILEVPVATYLFF
jgi:hypothetical protein